MRKKVENLTLTDESGQRYEATRISIYETGKVFGGGETFTGYTMVLEDGTQLEDLLGGKSFLDRKTGKTYKLS